MSSTDAWISALGEDSPSPFTALTATSVTLTSGDSRATGEYGGGAKRANLFIVDDSLSTHLCFGFVGTGGRRFCLKPLKKGSLTCGVAKHSVKFEPRFKHFYLKSTDGIGLCEPCFAESIVP